MGTDLILEPSSSGYLRNSDVCQCLVSQVLGRANFTFYHFYMTELEQAISLKIPKLENQLTWVHVSHWHLLIDWHLKLGKIWSSQTVCLGHCCCCVCVCIYDWFSSTFFASDIYSHIPQFNIWHIGSSGCCHSQSEGMIQRLGLYT